MLGTLENPYQLQEGEKVSRNGVFDLEIADYHRQICEGHSVSSSGLRQIINKSPLHYWAEYIDPERDPFETSESLILGQATHHLFLGEKHFDKHFVVRPDTYFHLKENKKKPWSNNANFCRAWNKDQEEAGLYILTSNQLKRIEGMARVLSNEPLIREQGLLSGAIERSLIWKDRETGIWLKARPDVIPAVEKVIVDLKTAGRSATDNFCQRAIYDHGYHIQLALVDMGMRACLGRDVEEFILLFVETTKPYAYNIKPVDSRAIYLGLCQIRHGLRTLAECLSKDQWPTYSGSTFTAHLPGYAEARLEQDLEAGLLPDIHNPRAHLREAAE